MPKKSHGQSNTRLYKIWQGMKARCYTDTCVTYHKYGAKGITVCDEWLKSFESFWDWANDAGYNDTLTLERDDSTLGYSPQNCKWATYTTQTRNTNRSKWWVVHGIKYESSYEAAEKLNVSQSRIKVMCNGDSRSGSQPLPNCYTIMKYN